MENTLQAVLNRAKTESVKNDPVVKKKTTPRKEVSAKQAPKQSRSNTVLIGGHFPPAVSKQLRIIAAEEGTTNQALLEQALDLLFVKKGKRHITEL